MGRNSSVLVVALCGTEGLTRPILKVIAAAGPLARAMGRPLDAAILGDGVGPLAEAVFRLGTHRVYVADHNFLETYDLEVHARALKRVIEEAGPDLVLIPETPENRDLAPYVALSLDGAVVTNCQRLSYHPSSQRLEALCTVMGGAARASYTLEGEGFKVVGLQPDETEAAVTPPETDRQAIIVDPGLDEFSPRVRSVGRTEESGPRLEDARVIVAGGKGLGAGENFRCVEELAETLDGLPAASRAIVDLGWATLAQQVGLTGKVVAPDLYFAVGISGASQHMVGCSRSKTIVAVNNDPDSHVFSYAQYGVVADCLEFIPAFIEECRRLAIK